MIALTAEWFGTRVLKFLAVVALPRANLVNDLQGTLQHLDAVFDRNLARHLRVNRRRRVTPVNISIQIPSLVAIWQEAAQLIIHKLRILASVHVYRVRSQLRVIGVQMLSFP